MQDQGPLIDKPAEQQQQQMLQMLQMQMQMQIQMHEMMQMLRDMMQMQMQHMQGMEEIKRMLLQVVPQSMRPASGTFPVSLGELSGESAKFLIKMLCDEDVAIAGGDHRQVGGTRSR